MTDDSSGATRLRSLTGPVKAIERGLLIAVVLLGAAWAGEAHIFLGLLFFKEQYLGLFFGLAISTVFLGIKARRGERGERVPWYDWILTLAGLTVGGYIAIRYPAISYQLGILTPDK